MVTLTSIGVDAVGPFLIKGIETDIVAPATPGFDNAFDVIGMTNSDPVPRIVAAPTGEPSVIDKSIDSLSGLFSCRSASAICCCGLKYTIMVP